MGERGMSAASVVATPGYYICDGVRRAVAVRDAGRYDVPVKIIAPGQPDVLTRLPLHLLHSPKTEIVRDYRYMRYTEYPTKVLGTDPPPLLVQPLGLQGQSPTTPLANVVLK